MRIIFAALLLLLSFNSSAQKVYGTVFTDKGDLLPYASVTVKGTSVGASANNKANFSFSLPPGTYTVVCQHIGYASTENTVTVSQDTEVTFILSEQKLTMKEVIVKTGAEDPAYEIIRQAIKKGHLLSQPGQCIYVRTLYKGYDQAAEFADKDPG